MTTTLPNPAWTITTENGDTYEERLSEQFMKWQREDLAEGNLWFVLSETGGGEENFSAGADEEEAQRCFSAWASGAAQDDAGWEEIEVVRVMSIEPSIDEAQEALDADGLDAAEVEADAQIDRDQKSAMVRA